MRSAVERVKRVLGRRGALGRRVKRTGLMKGSGPNGLLVEPIARTRPVHPSLDVTLLRAARRRELRVGGPFYTLHIMTAERRFSDDEVAFILERAAAEERALAAGAVGDGSRDAGTSGGGLTLQQLTEAAKEAGLSPTAVTNAARAIERGDLIPTQLTTSYGLPTGVARTIELGRAVTDIEWERMVVALRETFGARGRLYQEGSLRSWHNGNLQATLEPTARGHRLRMSTRKGDGRSGMQVGVAMMMAGGMLAIAGALSASNVSWWPMGLMGGIGFLSIVQRAVSLPSWAKTRATQMESFADTASRILAESDVRALEPANRGS